MQINLRKKTSYAVWRRKARVSTFLSLVILIGCAPHAHASTLSLLDIAKEFVEKIDTVYLEKVRISPIEQIPDGGTLLLKPRSQKLLYDEDIYAIKKNGTVYLAFDDVINILEFQIDYDKEAGTANGWFIREDWIFDADFNSQKVISKDVSYQVKPEYFVESDDLLFVEGQQLAKWLNLNFEYDIKDQILDIESPFPLPSIAKNLRESKRKNNDSFYKNQSNLPRLEQDKKDFDINTGDVFLGTRYNKSQTGDATTQNTANVILEGELLKHNSYLFASGDSENGLQNVVTRLTKRSEDPDLLGPLKARSYAIGDIDTVNLPLAGSTGQDLGFRFDNNKLENTDFAATDIEGDSIPGWDIELYRNEILVASQTVDESGRYRFDDIRLFIGDNEFELFFFGPQGEIRTEKLSAPVTKELLSSQNKTYEVSVTFEETQTLQENNSSDQDRNAPHLAARYNRLIGDGSLGFLGFKTNQIGGDRKVYLTSGLSSTLGQTLLDTNFAVDESGGIAAEAIARRRIANWDVSFNALANTDDYITTETEDPVVLRLGFNAQKAIKPMGFKTNLLIGGLSQKTANGSNFNNYEVGFSNNILGASLSNKFNYEKNEIVDGENTERYEHILSARKSWGKYYFRLGTTYEIFPEERLSNIIGQINYRHNSKFSGDLSYDEQLITDINTTRLNLNYTHDKFRLSPFFQHNSNDEVIAGVNLNFSLTDNPHSSLPDISNRRYVGRGALSALVYHDKDGNYIFDGDDEPLEDTIIESVNYKRRASTDAEGYASIKDLATSQATDIIVDPDTLPDPFMIPATKGLSVFPDAGSLYEMEFPVHLTGEIDGMAYYINEDIEMKDDENSQKQAISFQTISLYSLDKNDRSPIEVKTERDGYYVAFMIPPGRYLVTPTNAKKYGNTLPQIIDIGFEGTIIADINHEMIKDGAYVPYEVSFAQDDIDHQRYIKVKEKGLSKLSETLNAYLAKESNNRDLYKGLKSFKTTTEETGQYSYYTLKSDGNDFDSRLHKKCQNIIASGGQCTIVVNALLKNK